MPEDSWNQLKLLFQQALKLPLSEQFSFCQANCDDDSSRAQLLQMLQSHHEDSNFLKSPLDAPNSTDHSGLFIGRMIEDFQITERLGSGGMGIVFKAIQESPRRQVAIKLLQPGRDSEKMSWRLKHESEILARLDHPGVAHVYASGMTDFGHGQQPWFAMELVHGMPLHHHVATHPLGTDRKLRLFLDIADAVQHAHERGVIHRDLKPANIVIAVDSTLTANPDSLLRPKILDFGVARIVEDGRDASATFHTEVGEIAGTVSYMSPERFTQSPARIDHRCDVYALGVIGFELLGDTLPIDVRRLSLVDAIRSIEQQEPTPLGNLVVSLRGDPEIIFAKALEKDPARRYQSVRDLTDDIRRLLADEPIHARPISTVYRLQKFARRHQAAVCGVLATITALILGIILYASEAQQARAEANKSLYEAEKATAINNFITNDFFTKLLAAAKSKSPATEDQLPVQGLIAESAANVSSMFGDRPTIEAAVRNEVGTIHYNIGAFEQAAEQFQLAMALWSSELGPEHSDTLKAVNNLGMSFARLGRGANAEKLYLRALEGRRKVLGETDSYTLGTMNNLAELLRGTGRIDEAEKMLRRAYEGQVAASGADDKQTLVVLANLGSLLAQREQYDEAATMHQTVFETMTRTLGNDHITTLHAQREFSQSLYRIGKYNAAKDLLTPVLQAFEQRHGAANFDSIMARRLMSRIERNRGDTDSARAHLEAALAAANSNQETFLAVIPKIERDIKRLNK